MPELTESVQPSITEMTPTFLHIHLRPELPIIISWYDPTISNPLQTQMVGDVERKRQRKEKRWGERSWGEGREGRAMEKSIP